MADIFRANDKKKYHSGGEKQAISLRNSHEKKVL